MSVDGAVGEIVDAASVEIVLDGQVVLVPALWLRQACGCPDCRTSPLGQRTYELDQLLGSVGTVGAALREASLEGVRIDFTSDDSPVTHEGFVPYEALRSAFGRERGFAAWPTIDGWLGTDAVNANDPEMKVEVSTRVAAAGIALLRGVPTEAGEVLRVAGQLGFVRDTNYGAMFDVRSQPNPDNLAYSSAGLSPHTDNPYRDPCPTVQLLHCLRQAGTGGRSIFVDGFGVAERIRSARPADFEILSSTAVAFHYRDNDVDLRAVGPVVDTAVDGAVQRIRLNNRSMVGPVGSASPRSTTDFFEAYRRLVTDMNDDQSAVRLRLEPGDLVVFNNRRVLHGREAFALEQSDGDRWLQGCYIDLDAVLSTARLATERSD